MKSDIYNSFLHLPLHAYKYSTRQGMTRGGAVVGFSARAREGEKQRLPGGKKDLEVERNMTWVFSVPLCIRGSNEFECVRRRARGVKMVWEKEGGKSPIGMICQVVVGRRRGRIYAWSELESGMKG